MSHPPSPRRIAFLGNYTPRQCGIATFTRDLCEAVATAEPQGECLAVAMDDRPEGYAYPPRVRFEVPEKDLDAYRRAADFLNFNDVDVLCVQHEFGIFGGPAGSHLLTLLKEVRMPVVTTLHSVLREPDPDQRAVMAGLIRHSARLVVMARKGVDILWETYGVPETKVDLIPHGIPDLPFRDSSACKSQFGVEGRPVLLTFGLLSPGKGIEYAIQALPHILRVHPDAVYLVLGATHPHLLAQEGERYRLGLERLAEELGVRDQVIFYNRFVSPEDLAEFIGAADIYLTPYLNPEQITSGTLAYVFGAGKAIVSTPYCHAQELLADGRGILVPFRDPGAIAAGVCEFLGSAKRLAHTREEAYRLGRAMIWPSTATRYLESFQQARTDRRARPRAAFAGWTLANRPYELPPLRMDHLVRMTDDTGLFQHAIFDVPSLQEGYCTDDNARAFVLCCLLEELGGHPLPDQLDRLATRYLAFLAAALDAKTGRFRNFMSYGRQWLELAGSEESQGRALWALGTGMARSHDAGRQRLCVRLFDQSLTQVEAFSSPRAWAFTLLGIQECLQVAPDHARAKDVRHWLTAHLVRIWHQSATEAWPWFEPSTTYENARLCQALLVSAEAKGDEDALAIALKSLRWLSSVQKTPAGHFRPIGSNGFYSRDGARADFDQQPVEAQAMVSAALEAFRITGDPAWRVEAQRAFEWFLGRNDLTLPLYDARTGGCCDGLHSDRVNENQGAESTLAYHLARAAITQAEQRLSHPLAFQPLALQT
ncbi:MAG: glycosyltransferase family 4 protein [Acidobacteria bacterium]|nr:glycosyltransferase family 4 protein [Acidobacteriota bacterium]